MDRDCNKCIHHTTGTCSAFNCEFATADDVRNKAIDDFVKAVEDAELVFVDGMFKLEELAEQLKAGDNS